MGRTHLDALAHHQALAVTDIVETSPDVRGALAEDGWRVHDSLDQLLGRRIPDGILIAAPTTEHARLTKLAVAAGVPVLCEKPAGYSEDDVRDLAMFARRRRVPVQIGYWRRHVPGLVALRDSLQSGRLGAVYLVCAAQWDERPPSAQFRSSSGGIMLDMGVHEVDQIRWLTGQEVIDVHASAAGHVEDSEVRDDVDAAVVSLRLSKGTIATVSLGRYFPAGDMVEVEVFGTKGHERHAVLRPPDSTPEFHDALRRQAEAFVHLVRTGRGWGASLDDAAEAVRVMSSAASMCREVSAS